MKMNGKSITVYGNIDAPWTEDFEAVSAKVDAHAGAVEQNANDIDKLQTDVGSLTDEVNALKETPPTFSGATMECVVDNAAATEYTFNPASYDVLLIGAKPASNNRVICTAIPAAVAVAGLAFQVADESAYTKWNLTAAGIMRADGTGTLSYIYGIKL